jgi:hypothetical protein
MEDFAAAMQLYADLEKSRGIVDHESEDVVSNYFAARAQSTWTSGIRHDEDEHTSDVYEVCFNLAYELIALGKLKEAEEALSRAESIESLFSVLLTVRAVQSFWSERR